MSDRYIFPDSSLFECNVINIIQLMKQSYLFKNKRAIYIPEYAINYKLIEQPSRKVKYFTRKHSGTLSADSIYNIIARKLIFTVTIITLLWLFIDKHNIFQ